MGQFHNFRELQKYATKLARFKQEELLPYVDSTNRSQELMDLIGKGICGPLAVLWLRAQVLSPNYLTRDYSVKTMKFLEYGAIGRQIVYNANNDGKTAWDGVYELFKKFHFERIPEASGYFDSVPQAMMNSVQICYGAEGAVGVYTSGIPTEIAKPPHALAMVATENGLKFFDSNTGEYLITPGSENEFFIEYFKIYSTKLGYTFSRFAVIGVKELVGGD